MAAMTSRTSVLSDAQLTDSVADRLQHPKADGVTSFTLHAPLELLARSALLTYVETDARDAARDRLLWLGQTYAEAGDEVGEPGSRAYDDLATAVDHLTAAINAGDLGDADATAAWLAGWATPVELSRALADDVIPRLSAAGHGSILLYLLPRVAPRSRAATRPLRGLVRELARHPDWGLTWQQDRTAPPSDGGDLVAPAPPATRAATSSSRPCPSSSRAAWLWSCSTAPPAQCPSRRPPRTSSGWPRRRWCRLWADFMGSITSRTTADP